MVVTLQDNELINAILGVVVLAFLLTQRRGLGRLPHRGVFLASFLLLAGSWIVTLLEGFVLPTAMNYVEHAGYAGSAALLATWCWMIARPEGRREP